jgi:hypothetical protein
LRTADRFTLKMPSRMRDNFSLVARRDKRSQNGTVAALPTQNDQMAFPAKPGFYWAVWLTPSPGTRDAEALMSASEWEVVYVFENGISFQDRDYLRVLVTGVEQSQSIQNFRWGEGPLTPRS